MQNCHSCGATLNDGSLLATITFQGFAQSRLDGLSTRVHARCVRFAELPAEPMPPRISDPAAELVAVDWEPQGYTATCVEHGEVALKDTRDDAHLVAAMHLARVHVGVPA